MKPTVHSAFTADSDDDDSGPTRGPNTSLGSLQKRQARLQQSQALEEDPTVFQYDELYDDMADQRTKAQQEDKRKVGSQGPKYIKRLLATAEMRKKEYERRIERQVQKERDEEGAQFKDKESFVTSSYKRKLEEIKLAEEEEKRVEYLEGLGDVCKQSNLDSFYRHLFIQKTKTDTTTTDAGQTTAPVGGSRQYRKRVSVEEVEEEAPDKATEAPNVHIASNIDADSDFSIDSSDDEDEAMPPPSTAVAAESSEAVTSVTEPMAGGEKTCDATPEKENLAGNESEEDEQPELKKPKIDIWKKVTVGTAFDEAVRRYYERKAAR